MYLVNCFVIMIVPFTGGMELLKLTVWQTMHVHMKSNDIHDMHASNAVCIYMHEYATHVYYMQEYTTCTDRMPYSYEYYNI